MRKCPRGAGFTLIELLVVIAVIAIIAAILFPVFAQVREKARQIDCASNMKQIVTALSMYVQDYDETMLAEVSAPPINGGMDNSVPYDRQLAPYVRNDAVFGCPSDGAPRSNSFLWDGSYRKSQTKRSYAITNNLRTQEGIARGEQPDKNSGVVGAALAQIERPAETIAFAESWATFDNGTSDSVLGGEGGSTLLDCDAWKLPGRQQPSAAPIDNFAPCGDFTDPKERPAPGHHGLGNYAFGDGHVKALGWPQVRGNDFWLFKLKKPAQTYSPYLGLGKRWGAGAASPSCRWEPKEKTLAARLTRAKPPAKMEATLTSRQAASYDCQDYRPSASRTTS